MGEIATKKRCWDGEKAGEQNYHGDKSVVFTLEYLIANCYRKRCPESKGDRADKPASRKESDDGGAHNGDKGRDDIKVPHTLVVRGDTASYEVTCCFYGNASSGTVGHLRLLTR